MRNCRCQAHLIHVGIPHAFASDSSATKGADLGTAILLGFARISNGDLAFTELPSPVVGLGAVDVCGPVAGAPAATDPTGRLLLLMRKVSQMKLRNGSC